MNLFNKNSRISILLKNSISSFAMRFLNLAITAVMVPLTIHSLGTTDYAILAIVISSSLFFAYADLGLGLSIVNDLASIKTYQEQIIARQKISNIWYYLILVSVVVLSLSIIVISYLSKAHPALIANNGGILSWLVFAFFAALAIPYALVQRLLLGIQKVHEANIWYSIGRILSLLLVFICAHYRLPLWCYVFSVIGSPCIVSIVNTKTFFIKNPQLKPSLKLINLKILKKQMILGMAFFILQLSVYLQSGIDVLLINSYMAAKFVTYYDVMSKLYNYVPAIISVAAFPIWPAIRKAIAEDDINWVKKITLVCYSFIFAVSSLASIIFCIFHVKIIKIWAGINLGESLGLAIALALFSVLISIGTIQSMILNGKNLLWVQVKGAIIYILLLIPVKIFALKHFGISQMVFAVSFLYLIRIIYLEYGIRFQKKA